MPGFETATLVAAIKVHTQKQREAAVRGVTIVMETVLAEAVAICPIEEGALIASGVTEVKVEGETIHGAVGFGTGSAAAYAVPQHENTDFAHDAGREDHYLLKPLLRMQGKAGAIIAGVME